MSDTTRWASNLTDEQQAVIDRIEWVLKNYGHTAVMAQLRAAFSAKPREWVGWVGRVALDCPGDSVFSPTDKGEGWVRVRVTEILGDDSEAQS